MVCTVDGRQPSPANADTGKDFYFGRAELTVTGAAELLW